MELQVLLELALLRLLRLARDAVVDELDHSLFHCLPNRVSGNNVREVVVADVARTRKACDASEAENSVVEELLPPPDRAPLASGARVDVMRLVAQNQRRVALALKGFTNRATDVLESCVNVLDADVADARGSRSIDDLRVPNCRRLRNLRAKRLRSRETFELNGQTGFDGQRWAQDK